MHDVGNTLFVHRRIPTASEPGRAISPVLERGHDNVIRQVGRRLAALLTSGSVRIQRIGERRHGLQPLRAHLWGTKSDAAARSRLGKTRTNAQKRLRRTNAQKRLRKTNAQKRLRRTNAQKRLRRTNAQMRLRRTNAQIRRRETVEGGVRGSKGSARTSGGSEQKSNRGQKGSTSHGGQIRRRRFCIVLGA